MDEQWLTERGFAIDSTGYWSMDGVLIYQVESRTWKWRAMVGGFASDGETPSDALRKATDAASRAVEKTNRALAVARGVAL